MSPRPESVRASGTRVWADRSPRGEVGSASECTSTGIPPLTLGRGRRVPSEGPSQVCSCQWRYVKSIGWGGDCGWEWGLFYSRESVLPSTQIRPLDADWWTPTGPRLQSRVPFRRHIRYGSRVPGGPRWSGPVRRVGVGGPGGTRGRSLLSPGPSVTFRPHRTLWGMVSGRHTPLLVRPESV